jgi:hypothetical protein
MWSASSDPITTPFLHQHNTQTISIPGGSFLYTDSRFVLLGGFVMLAPVIVLGALAVGAAILWTRGAFGSSPSGETRTVNRSVPREGAQRTDLRLHLGAGVLTVQGGATGLVDAAFVSNMPDLDPDFVYRVTDSVAEVSITQPANVVPIPAAHMRYEWHVCCADNLPVDIDVECGAGTVDADLATVPVRQLRARTGAGQHRAVILASSLERFDLRTGAGRFDLDIRGTPGMLAHGSIHGGIGALQIRIPRSTPTRIHVVKAIGGINVRGFSQDGRDYANYASATSPTLEIDVHVGVGEVTLESVD